MRCVATLLPVTATEAQEMVVAAYATSGIATFRSYACHAALIQYQWPSQFRQQAKAEG